MQTNSVNIAWNKYETALLIDSYLSYTDGSISRKDAVASLSKRLRDGAVKRGMSISETFRNENGIDLQMSAMEYALTNGERGLDSPSKLFCDIAALYQNNKQEFQQILSVASIMYPTDLPNAVASKPHTEGGETDDEAANSFVANSTVRYYNSKIRKVLEKRFAKGYRLSSVVETRRMLRFFKEEYGYELDMEMSDIDEDVKACGIVYESRVYLPELMLSEEAKKTIVEFILQSFDKGVSCVYYSVLFSHFQSIFLENNIYDEQMLREYLEFINQYGWYFRSSYLSNRMESEANIQKEVEDYVKNQGTVVHEDELVKGLSYLPEVSVRSAFNERKTDLISCGRKQRFHIDNFVLSEDELEKVREIIRLDIKKFQYIGFAELMNDIRNQQPQIIENNAIFTEKGLRNVLAKRLSGEFSFINNIISEIDYPFSAEDCFRLLAQRDEYSYEDVRKVAEDCGSLANSYIEMLLGYSCRVTADKYVAKRFVHFDVPAIDAVLMNYCKNDYIAFCDIETLSVLPSCEYPWTDFLLESYVFNHSKLFKLIKPGYFGQQTISGAIVKRSSSINSFIDLAAKTIVDSNIELTETQAIEHLFNKGYIVQRRCENIKNIISAARLLKTNK